MKATLTFETETVEKINLIIRLALEMNIKVHEGSKEIKEYANDLGLTIASEPSLSEAWDSEEDTQWDTLYKQ